ncbi:4'-phosphopantetheinyl transferase family protein [Rhodoplanes azumiensis]|uniref:Enterobactin synthase component D n=1 Tax=Rhodoplanes azumiensis TaxID=1897628 RepID=A0ABW5ANM8_9BRAD
MLVDGDITHDAAAAAGRTPTPPSTGPGVADLQRVLDALAPGVAAGCRAIRPGDEAALREAEADSILSTIVAVRRASGAARVVARALLDQLGHRDVVLVRTASGAPVWPDGIVGSLAHDQEVAVAAVAKRSGVAALGIDVEPAEPLPDDIVDLVVTAAERDGLDRDPLHGRLLFAAKEAVYKAMHPLDGVFLDFHDIVVDLAARTAVVPSGRILDLAVCRAPRIVVLALLRA